MKMVINAEFGSDFQKKIATDVLLAMLQSWKFFYEAKHKKNKINYEIIEK